MRKIFFRAKLAKQELVYGKLLEKGSWVYGWYYQYANNHRIILPNQQQSQICLDVEPETVGQFTGFTDCKGVDVYEGDILAITLENGKVDYRPVVFNAGVFCLYFSKYGACTPLKDHDVTTKWEIVGTIADNPELANGGVR